MAKLSLTIADVLTFDKERMKDLCLTALEERGPEVRAELNTISSLDSVYRTRCAITFGVYSPQADFTPNVMLVSPVNAYIISGGRDYAELQSICHSVGYNMLRKKSVDSKHRGAVELAENIIGGTLPTFAQLVRTPGIKQKVASMISALADEYAEVITLDTWMIGGFVTGEVCYKTRQDHNYTMANAKAYHALADMLLDIARELHVSPFMLQWSVWCYFRGNRHESHLPIFGL